MSRQLIATSAAMLILSTAMSAASPALSEDEAAAFVHRFCTTLVPEIADSDPNAPGAGSPDDPSVFGPLVTPDLAEMIEQALKRRSAFQETTGEKPPLGDGVPWKGAQDAASDCAPGAVSGTQERPEVEVHYQYSLDPTQGWTDRLVLSRHAGEWRVDDIVYSSDGGWGRLRGVLVDAFE